MALRAVCERVVVARHPPEGVPWGILLLGRGTLLPGPGSGCVGDRLIEVCINQGRRPYIAMVSGREQSQASLDIMSTLVRNVIIVNAKGQIF